MNEPSGNSDLQISFAHAGVVVNDLDAVASFFAALGFERHEPIEIKGSWLDRIIGLEGAHSIACYVTPPGGGGSIELIEFRPPHVDPVPPDPPVHAHGVRHLAFETTDIAEVIDRAARAGFGLVGEIVDYEDSFRLVYIRGPEGLIIEFAQPLDPSAIGA